MNQRFHVLAGPTCNNNCIFCMEHDRQQRRHRYSRITPERVLKELREHRDYGDVMFTSGEPTANPNLPTYVRWARQLGYQQIGLTTNARRLSYEPYARRLVEEGLNLVVVSIHGPDARSHDGQTRTPGSFAQTHGALEVLARLKREHPLKVHTSTVVGRRNYKRLFEIYLMLQPFHIDQYVFNVMQVIGRAAKLVDRLVARYSDIVTEFLVLLEAVGSPRPEMFLVDLPLCTTERLPYSVRGYVELAFFREYTRHGRPALKESSVTKEEKNRIKRDECESCAYTAGCLGVWKKYIEAYGWDEFQPVDQPRASRSPRP